MVAVFRQAVPSCRIATCLGIIECTRAVWGGASASFWWLHARATDLGYVAEPTACSGAHGRGTCIMGAHGRTDLWPELWYCDETWSWVGTEMKRVYGLTHKESCAPHLLGAVLVYGTDVGLAEVAGGMLVMAHGPQAWESHQHMIASVRGRDYRRTAWWVRFIRRSVHGMWELDGLAANTDGDKPHRYCALSANVALLRMHIWPSVWIGCRHGLMGMDTWKDTLSIATLQGVVRWCSKL